MTDTDARVATWKTKRVSKAESVEGNLLPVLRDCVLAGAWRLTIFGEEPNEIQWWTDPVTAEIVIRWR